MHVILWEFTIKPEKQQTFLDAYGPEGNWAQLFRRAEGYLGTELLQSDQPATSSPSTAGITSQTSSASKIVSKLSTNNSTPDSNN
jgi:hypothetical protein